MENQKEPLPELNQNEFNDTLAEIEISYKKKISANLLEKIINSGEANRLFRKIWSTKIEHIEEAYMLCLNRANKVLGYFKLSAGGIFGTVVDIRIILQVAIKTNSVSIILSHNHPSGNLQPSEADIKLTKKVREACKLLDITFLDHIILTEEEYFSFADNGIL